MEHKHLGSDYEMKPFWGPPVTPCRNCKYEKALEAHRFGGVVQKRVDPSPISEEKAHAYGLCNEAACLYCKAAR